MITNNDTLTVPVGVTPDGEQLTVDLRRNTSVLVAGIAGSGKSTLLRRMRGALEPQLDAGLLFHAEGIRANADDVILAARDERRRRMRERRIDDSPAVLLVDDFGVMCIGRDRSDESVRAIEEIARTLKPGGFHICTVPIMNKAEPSVRRARRRCWSGPWWPTSGRRAGTSSPS